MGLTLLLGVLTSLLLPIPRHTTRTLKRPGIGKEPTKGPTSSEMEPGVLTPNQSSLPCEDPSQMGKSPWEAVP